MADWYGGAHAWAWLAAAAVIGVLAAEEWARRAGRAMGWQEPGETRIHPRALPQAMACAAATAALAWGWRSDPHGALVVAAGAILSFHACAVDMRDRWLPDYATVPLLVLGLLASPMSDQHSRVTAMAVDGALVVAWQALMPLLATRRLGWDMFWGGDQVLGAAAGAWLGMGPGQTALVIAVTTMMVAMAVVQWTGGAGGRAGRLAGVDEGSPYLPAGVYVSLGTWIMVALGTPWGAGG